MNTRAALAIILAAASPSLAASYPRSINLEAKPTAAEAAAALGTVGEAEGGSSEGPPWLPPDLAVAHADLNGDGRLDLLLRINDIVHCGSRGCATHALLATAKGYADRPIDLATSAGPITLLETTHKGMRDLRFGDSRYVFKWDGERYR